MKQFCWHSRRSETHRGLPEARPYQRSRHQEFFPLNWRSHNRTPLSQNIFPTAKCWTESSFDQTIDRGFIFKHPGTSEQPQEELPMGVFGWQVGIATSDSRPPRFVVDSSICGLNSRCVLRGWVGWGGLGLGFNPNPQLWGSQAGRGGGTQQLSN